MINISNETLFNIWTNVYCYSVVLCLIFGFFQILKEAMKDIERRKNRDNYRPNLKLYDVLERIFCSFIPIFNTVWVIFEFLPMIFGFFKKLLDLPIIPPNKSDDK